VQEALEHYWVDGRSQQTKPSRHSQLIEIPIDIEGIVRGILYEIHDEIALIMEKFARWLGRTNA
jgi:hypothetical protein